MKIARNLEKIVLVLCDFSLSIGQIFMIEHFPARGMFRYLISLYWPIDTDRLKDDILSFYNLALSL